MTNYKFNIKEIFEIAEQIERNGADFYRQAAMKFENDPQIKKLLIQLAVQEDNHEKAFSEILNNIINREEINPDNELTRQYLDAIAGQFVFNKETLKNEIVTDMSKSEIFDAAILKEKESIVFYVGLKGVLKSDKDKKAIDLLIEEEQRHLVDLRRYSDISKYKDETF